MVRLLLALGLYLSLLAAEAPHLEVFRLVMDGGPEEKVRGEGMLEELGNGGNREASFILGYLYKERGEKEAAFRWYLKAAEQGETAAMVITGWNYYKGNGCEEDREKSRAWLEKAAAGGDRSAVELLRLLE